METKENIRKEIFARRKAASQEDIEKNSELIFRTVTGLPEFLEADCFFAYMDFRKEVMTRRMIRYALDLGKIVAVPRVEGSVMRFYEITSFDQLHPGYFGIEEPDGDRECICENGFLLVPGVAFDPMRHRIGYGRGFYDRYLSAHPAMTTAAVAFAFQVLDQVPHEELDILPQMLITENNIYR